MRINLHETFPAITLVAAPPAAVASNFGGGEIGYEPPPVDGALTREQVRREYGGCR